MIRFVELPHQIIKLCGIMYMWVALPSAAQYLITIDTRAPVGSNKNPPTYPANANNLPTIIVITKYLFVLCKLGERLRSVEFQMFV